MSDCPDITPCSLCHRPAKRLIAVCQHVSDGKLSDKTIRDFRHVFNARDYASVKTSKDVDRGFDAFHRKYPHLGHPGPVRQDPLPGVDISDGRENNPEGRRWM